MRDMSQLVSRQAEEEQRRSLEDLAATDLNVVEMRDKTAERWRLLWEERRFLRKALLYGMLFGVAVAFLIPKHYKSTTQLMPPDSSDSPGMAMIGALAAGGGGGAGGGLTSGLGALAGDILGLKNTGEEFVGILRSRTVQDRLVARFNLQDVYSTKYEEDACRELSDNTGVSEDRKSGIITIEVSDRDPQRATAIAQGYVDELNRLAAEVSTSSAHRERVFLEGRLQEVRRDLNKASVDFSEFASKNTAIDIEEQGKAMVEAAAGLQGELIASQSELKGLEQIYAPSNVRIRSVKSRIAELQAQLDKLGGPSNGIPDKSVPGAPPAYPTIRQLPVLGVRYFDLFREAKIQEAVYEALTQQYEMSKVQEAKETPTVKVLDAASLPQTKSFPPRILIIMMITVLSLAGACYWTLVRVRWQRTDPSDPRKVLAEEIFQTVNAKMPWSTPNGSRFHALTHRAWIRIARKRQTETAREDMEKDREE